MGKQALPANPQGDPQPDVEIPAPTTTEQNSGIVLISRGRSVAIQPVFTLLFSRCSARNRRARLCVIRSETEHRGELLTAVVSYNCIEWRGIAPSPLVNSLLPAIVREGLIRFCHLVHIFALLDGVTAIVRRIENLAGKLVLHGFLTT